GYLSGNGRVTRVDGPVGGTPSTLYNVESLLGFFGSRLQTVGDCDADGYDDFAVGAPSDDAGGSNAGAIYLFKGGQIPPSSWLFKFQGENPDDYLGYIDYAVGA
ncbi:MAG: integrin alpha, partial [Spirochaetota bacterium]